MRAGGEIDQRRAGLHRRSVRVAGRIHDAGDGLHGQVHRRIVAIGAVVAVAGGLRDDQARVDLLQLRLREAQPVHHAGAEILHQHVGGFQKLR